MPDDDQTWPPAPIRPPPPRTVRCPNCGTDNLPEGTVVCPICSVSLGQTPPPLFASLSGFVGLLLMTACGLAASVPAVASSQALLLLMVGGAFTGLVLLAFAFLIAFWGGLRRR